MRKITYFCEKCRQPYAFDSLKDDGKYLCPRCGQVMMYWCTEEIDPTTNKVVERYDEIERKRKNPSRSCITIECPYCHSTNTSKITSTSKIVNTALFGVFGTKRHKEWHCNRCGSDF